MRKTTGCRSTTTICMATFVETPIRPPPFICIYSTGFQWRCTKTCALTTQIKTRRIPDPTLIHEPGGRRPRPGRCAVPKQPPIATIAVQTRTPLEDKVPFGMPTEKITNTAMRPQVCFAAAACGLWHPQTHMHITQINFRPYFISESGFNYDLHSCSRRL